MSVAAEGKALPGRSIGYLVSQYPALSHTFILREVRELRRRGLDIRVASVNSCDRRVSDLTEEERSEAETTFCLKEAGARGALASQLSLLRRRPGPSFRTLIYALALAGIDIRRMIKNFFYFIEAAMIARWMLAHKLKHLHVHFGTPASTVALLTARLIPVTLSMTIHGPDEFDEVSKYLLREKIEACQFICAISCYTRSQLLRLSDVAHWPKVWVTPLGVDTALFQPRSALNGRPAGKSRDFEILCVGRLVPAKGQRVLVEAIDRLLKRGRRVHLVLAGDGPDRESLTSRVQNGGLVTQVEFAGPVNQDRIRDLYEHADAFALASFAEGVPVVLMEAMSMAIPCVATWVAGIPELIRSGVDGLLVAPSDEAGLAEALARLMDDPEFGRQLGQAGRQRVIEKYNLQNNVAHLAEVFGGCARVAA